MQIGEDGRHNTLEQRLHRITEAVERIHGHFATLRAVLCARCPEEGEAPSPQTAAIDRTLARNVSEAVVLLGEDLEILYANSSAARMIGTSEQLLLGKSLDTFLLGPPGNSSRAAITESYQTLAPGGSLPLHGFSARTRVGETQPVHVVLARPEAGEDPSALVLATRSDQKEESSPSVEYLVYHDQLTSLGNRELLMHSVDQILAEVSRDPDRTAALLYLDLDGFKKINDSLGHVSGDAIILETARRIGATLRGYDRVFRVPARDLFRLGGDEFTVLLSHLKRPEEAGRVATRIIERLKEPYVVDGPESVHAVTIGGSVGIVLIPQDGDDASTLLRNADTAMYSAKEQGNRYVYFQKEMNNKAMERLILEEGLRQSFREEQFVLHYQAIVDEAGRPTGLEALIRWRHPERGLIRPDTFVHIAEEARLLPDIGGWVLRRALRDLKHLHGIGFENLYVTVNVSPRQLETGDMAEVVHAVLANTDMPADKLVLELTETAVMSEPQTAIERLNRLVARNPGLRIAVDDFGTGYSSLSYLSRLPVHMLKVDKEFVQQLDDASNGKIVDTILRLGTSLGLHVVAEGVETETQHEILEAWGCSSFQGFRFTHPLAFNDLMRYLREARSPHHDTNALLRRSLPDELHRNN